LGAGSRSSSGCSDTRGAFGSDLQFPVSRLFLCWTSSVRGARAAGYRGSVRKRSESDANRVASSARAHVPLHAVVDRPRRFPSSCGPLPAPSPSHGRNRRHTFAARWRIIGETARRRGAVLCARSVKALCWHLPTLAASLPLGGDYPGASWPCCGLKDGRGLAG